MSKEPLISLGTEFYVEDSGKLWPRRSPVSSTTTIFQLERIASGRHSGCEDLAVILCIPSTGMVGVKKLGGPLKFTPYQWMG